jgi:hypothetical protein
VSPGAHAADVPIVTISAGSGLELVNHATTGPAGSPNTIDFRRRLDRAVLEVIGSIPVGAAADTRDVAVVNPTVFFAQSLKDGLIARGITVTGGAVDFDDIAAEISRRGLYERGDGEPLRGAQVRARCAKAEYRDAFCARDAIVSLA